MTKSGWSGTVLPIPRRIQLAGQMRLAGIPPHLQVIGGEKPALGPAAELLRQWLRNGDRGPLSGRVTLDTFGSPETARQEAGLPSVPEAYAVTLRGRDGSLDAQLIGRTPRACLHAVATFASMLRQEGADLVIPLGDVQDWPALRTRGLIIPLVWYTGYWNTRYDSIVWEKERWLQLVEWAALCKLTDLYFGAYGYWPFPLQGFPKAVLRDVEFEEWNVHEDKPQKVRWTHPNVADEFLPEVIARAHELGIRCHLQIGLNSYNGGYLPEYDAKQAVLNGEQVRFSEACWSDPANQRYWTDTLSEIMTRYPFDGLVVETAESPICECADCTRKYRKSAANEFEARISGDLEWLNLARDALLKARPRAELGLVFHWPSIAFSEMDSQSWSFLTDLRDRLPSDVLINWLPPADEKLFERWVQIFGPERCIHYVYAAQSLWDRMPFFHGTNQQLNAIEFCAAETETAVRHGLRGAMAEGCELVPHELHFAAVAQYAWNQDVTFSQFLAEAAKSLYGGDSESVLSAIRHLNRFPLPSRQVRSPGARGRAERVITKPLQPSPFTLTKLNKARGEGRQALKLLRRSSGEGWAVPESRTRMITEAERKQLIASILAHDLKAQKAEARARELQFKDYSQAVDLARNAWDELEHAAERCGVLHALLATAYPAIYPFFADRKLLSHIQQRREQAKLALGHLLELADLSSGWQTS